MRAFNASDYDTITALVSEDCRYHVAGGGIFAGEYTGRNAFAEFLRKAKAETQATMTVDVQVRDRKRRSRDNLRRCPRGA